jgi:hypothetical protein
MGIKAGCFMTAIVMLLIGYALGFWMPALGNKTLARLYPRG